MNRDKTTATAQCNCAAIDNAIEGEHRYCGVHDRATPYTGPVLHPERRMPNEDHYGPGLAW